MVCGRAMLVQTLLANQPMWTTTVLPAQCPQFRAPFPAMCALPTVLTVLALLSLVTHPALGSGADYGLTERAPVQGFLAMPQTFSIEAMPTRLSLTGAFSDPENLAITDGLIPYNVIAPLWSDGAAKTRWIAIPNDTNSPETQIGFASTGEWSFPSGSVFVKHFELITDESNPAVRRRLETRLLVMDANGAAYGVTYKWRPDNSDADLLTTSLKESILITNTAGVHTQVWYYPSPNDCLSCHTDVAGYVLGVKSRQLNTDFSYPVSGITDNELRSLNHIGLFNPPIDDESTIASFPKLSSVTNALASPEDRARSYLDSNCAQCHRPGGVRGSGWDARFDTPLASQKIVNGKINKTLNIDGAAVVVPEDVWRSMIYLRLATLDTSIIMPPLAHSTLDTNAIEAMADWINSLPGVPALAPPTIYPAGGTNAQRAITVTISSPDPQATLHYTLDDSNPTTNSPAYTAPLLLSTSATLKARASRAGYETSVPTSAQFIIYSRSLQSPAFDSLTGRFSFQIQALPGASYVVQASTNLVDWLPMSTNVATSVNVTIIDATVNKPPIRYYRFQGP